ncbi:MAG: bifunctional homocysteine S-methyltransferase/methylenetetrahydrofolate reductase [Ignavibacteriae bacterium]|nr:bifunctional homocysteine S-methyltransferase/methylenetetrahydrofolate reductase [Ignavibacteriota bacterium]MCB9214748.1 bifunctional homocysteine S-methyltransferase/methylenetetrahydrofolate reductase [Ignavibacteria bacterium]
MIDLRERLGSGNPVVIDGSMEAALRAEGYNEHPIEIYNLKNPLLIERLHTLFIDAGAEIIQANTTGGNALTLAPYKLDDKVYEINRKGVWLARTAALGKAYVAGVVGPVGKFFAPVGTLKAEDARDAYAAQIHALLDGGCDLLILKSFINVDDLELALGAARHVSNDIPIIAQKTFPEDGSVLASEYPREIARRLEAHDVVAVGSNGTVGPQRMRSIVRALRSATDSILSAQPDIGTPTLVDGMPIYNATTEYVARSVAKLVESGVTIIGADGGADPEYIRAISKAVAGLQVGKPEIKPRSPKPALNELSVQPESGQFGRRLGKDFLITAEVGIPRGLDMRAVYQEAAYFKEIGVDAINIFDGARARLRISPITISHLVEQQVGIECITHLACRDRNMVGLQAELLGAHSLGLRTILAVTGDPTHIGDYPYATSVYDVDAVGLVRALKRMNQGLDLVGNPIGGPTRFTIACAVNPVAEDMEREIIRLERKVEEGAEVAFTQPVFDRDTLYEFLERINHIPVRIMLGLSLLSGARHAEFLHHEVPGMTIPQSIQERLREAVEPVAEGVNVTVEFIESIGEMPEKIAGLYIMPPNHKEFMVKELLQRTGLRKYSDVVVEGNSIAQ